VQPTVNSGQANICLGHLVLRMVWKK